MKKSIYLFLLVCIIGFSVYFFYPSNSQSMESIPEQAIRLRILAHSDSAQDQWVKRKVRDEIVQEIQSWPHQPTDQQKAREEIQQSIPAFQQLAEQTLQEHGFSYPVTIQFGSIPFPTKLYGGQVYPAGEYEGLLITLGKGNGDNWWCVLFPPLCFIDMESGEAEPKQEQQVLSASTDTHASYTNGSSEESPRQGIEVRFLLWERVSQWFR